MEFSINKFKIMFDHSKVIESIDFSNFDFSQVIDMNDMFNVLQKFKIC